MSFEARPAVSTEVAIEIVQKANTAVERLVASSQLTLEETTFTTEVASRRAFDKIVRRAREWRADLIVLGAKGTTSLEEIILGGTAEQAMKEAPCSV